MLEIIGNPFKSLNIWKGMLHLIGIGNRKEQINPQMLEVIKKSNKIFLEYYTSFYETPFDELEKYLGKTIKICDRGLIENNIEKEILEPAKTESIALLVLGDPLIATTHTDLIIRGNEMGVETKIYNNVSIVNHITKTGLQFYKFGKITSIPFFSEKFMPRTPYLVFIDNFKMGAHSLFLLDLDPIENKYLRAGEALKFLLKIPDLMVKEEEIEEREAYLIDEESLAIVCSRLGFEDEKIVYSSISNLIILDEKEAFREPLCIIIPGDLHEMEEKYLERFKK